MHTRRDLFFWQSNPAWWDVDEKEDKFVLTDAAPEEARKNFEQYLVFIKEREEYMQRLEEDDLHGHEGE